jgi:2-keto-3-deoxy-L-rhamnonate aldolase RhmA
MAGQSFKARLQSGHAADGCFLEMFSPIAAEIMARAGYESVMIDLEHGPGAVMDAISLIQAVQGCDCAPLLRVAANDPVAIKRALDIGLAGVMIPAVGSPAEAEAAVAACHYPPRGVRGMAASVVRATGHGAAWQDYVAGGADELLVMCQIENVTGVLQVADIAAIEGVDMLFIGPFDLSASIGHLGQPDHPDVRGAITRVEQAAKAAGKLLGIIPTPGRSAAELFAAGYDLVLGGADNVLLREAAEADVANLKAARKS